MDKKKVAMVMGNNVLYPGVYVYDKFTGVNGTSLDAHILDKPKSALWSEAVGVWDIQSNQANVVSITSYALAAVESYKADCTLSVILKTVITADNPGLVMRYIDTNNYLVAYLSNGANTVGLVKKVAGTLTIVLANANESLPVTDGNDYVMEVVLLGNTIKIYIDGALQINTTCDNHLTATKHGIYSEKALAKFDEFQVSR